MIKLLIVALAAMLSAPAFAQDAAADLNMPWRQLISAAGPYFHPEGSESTSVLGEKLDAGLGEAYKASGLRNEPQARAQADSGSSREQADKPFDASSVKRVSATH